VLAAWAPASAARHVASVSGISTFSGLAITALGWLPILSTLMVDSASRKPYLLLRL